jgi:two-component system response regulator
MNTKNILLVEDNPDDVELTLMAFRENKISNPVTVAWDGAEALELLFGKEGSPPPAVLPALVLLDLKLPKVDGLEVLRRIRVEERTQCLAVVILTSSKEEQDVAMGYRLGCNSYIRKPVDFAQFLEASRQLGLYWLLLNEAPPIK